jgi:hypothetical protein
MCRAAKHGSKDRPKADERVGAMPTLFVASQLLRSAAGKEVADERDDPDNRENVDEHACAVGEDFAQDPQQEKNTGNTKKHIDLLRCL